MIKKPCDYPILFTTILLVAIGIIMVFSASFYYAQQPPYNDSYYFFKKQVLGAVIGFIGMIFFTHFPYWKLEKYAKWLVFASLVMLVAVLIPGVGQTLNGASRWINIGGFSIQPAEIAKFALIVFMASSMTKRRNVMKSLIKGVVPYLLIMMVYFGLIIAQPNLSTAGCIAILAMIMIYVGGAKLWHLGILVGGGAAAAWALILSEGYRFKRLMAFQNPWAAPRDEGYQLIQSLYALGSGGLFGMGLGNSRQKFLFLPYRESDFIFAIIGEELGFIGACTIMVLFLVLIWRGLRVAITSPDLFGSLLATGIVSIIGIQVIINIAVVTGSMPPTGLPLPFISAGSSSLIIFMASIGVLLNISKYTKSG
ncbi:MAG: stage V sporulation protein E [Clostridia bacterium]|jgi:cell division protein FtsW